jgi:glucosamine--fructose-6-phosphate aminotransferase (isomerizing)
MLHRFLSDLKALPVCITEVLATEPDIIQVAKAILAPEKHTPTGRDLFVLGRDEYHGVALEGALKIKEIAYMHAEGFHIASLKHGPYALITDQVPVIIIYKEYNHFIKSVVSELRTRKAMLILVSNQLPEEKEMTTIGIRIPLNETFGGFLSVITLQLLAYHLSVLQGINPDMPRNLAKVVTVD